MGKDYGSPVTVGVLELTVIAHSNVLALRRNPRLRTLGLNQVST
jgi:hypothetical protein